MMLLGQVDFGRTQAAFRADEQDDVFRWVVSVEPACVMGAEHQAQCIGGQGGQGYLKVAGGGDHGQMMALGLFAGGYGDVVPPLVFFGGAFVVHVCRAFGHKGDDVACAQFGAFLDDPIHFVGGTDALYEYNRPLRQGLCGIEAFDGGGDLAALDVGEGGLGAAALSVKQGDGVACA